MGEKQEKNPLVGCICSCVFKKPFSQGHCSTRLSNDESQDDLVFVHFISPHVASKRESSVNEFSTTLLYSKAAWLNPNLP